MLQRYELFLEVPSNSANILCLTTCPPLWRGVVGSLMLLSTYLQCHQIQLAALLCGNLLFLVMVFPWSKHQQLSSRTSIELFAIRLRKWREAVLHDDDGG